MISRPSAWREVGPHAAKMIGSVVAAWWGFGGFCSRIDSRFPIKKKREAL